MSKPVKIKRICTRKVATKILSAIDLFEDENEKIIASSIANMALGSPVVDDDHISYINAIAAIANENKINYIAYKVTNHVREN